MNEHRTPGAETRADQQHYLSGGLQPLDCRNCGNRVLVKKESPEHTSVQWTSDSASSCPQLGARVAAGQAAARVESCGHLKETIDQAAREGRLEVPLADDRATAAAEPD